jgi:hypothetical protein
MVMVFEELGGFHPSGSSRLVNLAKFSAAIFKRQSWSLVR